MFQSSWRDYFVASLEETPCLEFVRSHCVLKFGRIPTSQLWFLLNSDLRQFLATSELGIFFHPSDKCLTGYFPYNRVTLETSMLLNLDQRRSSSQSSQFRIDDSANYSHISLQHTIQIFLFVAPLVTVVENGLKGPSGRVSRTITSTSQEQMDRKAGGLHAPTRCKHDNMNWHIYNHY